MNSRIDQYQENDLKALSEWLESLRITKEDTSNKTTETETTDTMSIVPVQAV